MYFDLEPKSKRADLYNFEEPLEKLQNLLGERRARAPLIIVTGQRRTGKTSLVRTALFESGLPYIWLDGHAFADTPIIKKRSLFLALERELNEAIARERTWGRRISEALRGIRWLKVDSKPPWIHFEWERPDRDFDVLDLVHSFDALARENRTKFVLVFDEAQEFRKLKGYSLQTLMSYVYDNLSRVQMIVTGSQFGFLYDFLGIDNPSSPLYGRGMVEIQVPRVSKDVARDFLEKGFRQAGIKPVPAVITSAIEKLDGVMGWLTLFGSKSVELGSCSERALRETIETGSKLAFQEFRHFLRLRGGAERRYEHIMKTVARSGPMSWGDLKRALEIVEGRPVADKIFTNLLENLVEGGFLEKKGKAYSITDPLLLHAFRD